MLIAVSFDQQLHFIFLLYGIYLLSSSTVKLSHPLLSRIESPKTCSWYIQYSNSSDSMPTMYLKLLRKSRKQFQFRLPHNSPEQISPFIVIKVSIIFIEFSFVPNKISQKTSDMMNMNCFWVLVIDKFDFENFLLSVVCISVKHLFGLSS